MPTRDDYFSPYPRAIPLLAFLTARLAADLTNATATFANALSIQIQPGVPLSFRAELQLANSTAADGFKIDFNGGTVVADRFWAMASLYNTAGAILTLSTGSSTTLAGTINASLLAATTVNLLSIAGSIRSSGGGILTLRAAENSHTTGTLTISEGSCLWASPPP
jgi:hypothetical protein